MSVVLKDETEWENLICFGSVFQSVGAKKEKELRVTMSGQPTSTQLNSEQADRAHCSGTERDGKSAFYLA